MSRAMLLLIIFFSFMKLVLDYVRFFEAIVIDKKERENQSWMCFVGYMKIILCCRVYTAMQSRHSEQAGHIGDNFIFVNCHLSV